MMMKKKVKRVKVAAAQVFDYFSSLQLLHTWDEKSISCTRTRYHWLSWSGGRWTHQITWLKVETLVKCVHLMKCEWVRQSPIIAAMLSSKCFMHIAITSLSITLVVFVQVWSTAQAGRKEEVSFTYIDHGHGQSRHLTDHFTRRKESCCHKEKEIIIKKVPKIIIKKVPVPVIHKVPVVKIKKVYKPIPIHYHHVIEKKKEKKKKPKKESKLPSLLCSVVQCY